MSIIKVVLVDDNEQFLDIYSKIIEHHGYEVYCASNGQKALEWIRSNETDIVVTDMVMPQLNGLELILQVKQLKPSIQFIVVTGEASVHNAVEVMKSGAYTYLQKPLNIDELLFEMGKLTELMRLLRLNESLQFSYNSDTKALIGVSEVTESIRETIRQISKYDSNVLITGESGTGKEIVAALIHENSKRSDFPMIRVNCSALSENILESELFGHERGAFTGANTMRKGRFELSNGSTLFIDEIGELSPNAQIKLLRVIQEKTFERVGGSTPIKTDFRLIAATNRDLKLEITNGNFREDLFYRLNVIPIHLPPLRERQEDIFELVKYFARKYAIELNKTVLSFTPQAAEVISGYSWPGNTRELKNMIERLAVYSQGQPVDLIDLPKDIIGGLTSPSNSSSLKDAVDRFEREFIKGKLIKNNWGVSNTAKEIGIARKNLYLKIKHYDLK